MAFRMSVLWPWLMCIGMVSYCCADEVWRSATGTYRTGNDQEAELTELGGLETCEQELQHFHRTAKNTSQLDTEDWMESSLDDTLCKAGLWNCKRSTSHRIDCPGKGNAVGVVFIVTVSDNSWKGVPEFKLLEELLDALSDPAHYFLISLDLNSSPAYKDNIIELVKQHSHAALVQHPFPCTWAGASVTASELSALADVYYMYEQNCVDTVVLMSSSDFVAKGVEAIKSDLADHAQYNLFDYFGAKGAEDSGMFHDGPVFNPQPKHDNYFVLPECWSRPVSVLASDIHPMHSHTNRWHTAIADWPIVLGSQYWILNQAAVRYLVTDQRVLYLWHLLKHTTAPEEAFFQTALHNSPELNSTIREGALRYIGPRQHGRMVDDTDQDALLTCKYSFVRKFEKADTALRVTAASQAACTR